MENLESYILVDHLEEGGLFADIGYGFRSSCSTADPLTIIADGIARAFNIFVVAQIVGCDIPKPVDRVWHAGLHHKRDSHGIHGHVFKVISSFMVLDSKRVLY